MKKSLTTVSKFYWQAAAARRGLSLFIDTALAGGLVWLLIFFPLADFDGQILFGLLLLISLSPLPIIYLRLFFKIWHNMPTAGEALTQVHVIQQTYPVRSVGREIGYALWQWKGFISLVIVGFVGAGIWMCIMRSLDWFGVALIEGTMLVGWMFLTAQCASAKAGMIEIVAGRFETRALIEHRRDI